MPKLGSQPESSAHFTHFPANVKHFAKENQPFGLNSYSVGAGYWGGHRASYYPSGAGCESEDTTDVSGVRDDAANFSEVTAPLSGLSPK
jgi:hypothetical protein